MADDAAATGNTGRDLASALVALRLDLGRGIGNNINQLAHRVNGGGHVPNEALVSAADDVAMMRDCVERVSTPETKCIGAPE